MKNKLHCKLIEMPGEPVQIYGFTDYEKSLPDIVYVLDSKGYVISCNQQTRVTIMESIKLDHEAEKLAETYRNEIPII